MENLNVSWSVPRLVNWWRIINFKGRLQSKCHLKRTRKIFFQPKSSIIFAADYLRVFRTTCKKQKRATLKCREDKKSPIKNITVIYRKWRLQFSLQNFREIQHGSVSIIHSNISSFSMPFICFHFLFILFWYIVGLLLIR